MKNHIASTALIIMSLATVGCGGGGETVNTSAVETDSSTQAETQPQSNTTSTEEEQTSEASVVVEQNTEVPITIVSKSNIAPSISGNPNLTGREDEAYTFTPTATDEDNGNLSFSVKNKPEWMSFNRMTGELSGTPVTDDIGEYTRILISVSDGETITSLNSFNLTVKSTSATLSWIAPSTRTDGSSLPMAEIAGYKVYMGSSTNNLTLVNNITDPYIMEHKISSLSEGTYYFAVTTYGENDIESDLSAIVSKNI